MAFGRKKKQNLTEIDELAAEQARIDADLARLQFLVESEPERLEREINEIKREQAEKEMILSPLSELTERARENAFENRLKLGELRNERRTQGVNLVVLILLIAAIYSLGSWVYKQFLL